MKKLVLALAT